MNDYLLFVGALNLGITLFQQIRQIFTDYTERSLAKKEVYYASIVDEISDKDIHRKNCDVACRHKGESTLKERENAVNAIKKDISKNISIAKLETLTTAKRFESVSVLVALVSAVLISIILFFEWFPTSGWKYLYLFFMFPSCAMIIFLPAYNFFKWCIVGWQINGLVKHTYCKHVLNEAKKRAKENRDTKIVQFPQNISDSQH